MELNFKEFEQEQLKKLEELQKQKKSGKLTQFEKDVKRLGGYENYWTDKISKKLVGKTITKVGYLSVDETEDRMWYKRPCCIQLDNQYWLIPMADDEGNDGGSVSVSFMKGLTTIPTL